MGIAGVGQHRAWPWFIVPARSRDAAAARGCQMDSPFQAGPRAGRPTLFMTGFNATDGGQPARLSGFSTAVSAAITSEQIGNTRSNCVILNRYCTLLAVLARAMRPPLEARPLSG